ncbi:MAG: hypothetical protein V1702_06740 [Candidatus Woesearchaeota archaeon]
MKSKLTEMALSLEIEKSKIQREKSLLLIDKGLLLYFSFLFIGVIGFLNHYVTTNVLNMMVIMSFGVLGIAIWPYIVTMHKEEKKLDEMLREIRGGKNA